MISGGPESEARGGDEPRNRRLCLLGTGLFGAATLGLLPLAARPVPFGAPLAATTSMAMLVVDLAAAFLLYSRFRAAGLHHLLLLGSACLLSAAASLAVLLTYPGAILPSATLVGGIQAAPWSDLEGRLGFAALTLAAVASDLAWKWQPVPPGRIGRVLGISLALVGFLSVCGFILPLVVEASIPLRGQDGQWTPWDRGGHAVSAAFAVVAIGLIWRRASARGVFYRCVGAMLVVFSGGAVAHLAGGGESSLGDSVGRIDALLSASLLFILLLRDSGRLYWQAGLQRRGLRESATRPAPGHSVFSLGDVLQNVATVVATEPNAKAVEIVFDVAPGIPPSLLGNPLRLQEVLISLAANAMRFTSAGEVVVKVTLTGADAAGLHIEFSVRDTEIGIAADHRDRLFPAFSEGDFRFSAIYGFPPGAGAATASGGGRAAEARRILFVGDNAAARDALCHAAAALGWQAEAAGDPSRFLFGLPLSGIEFAQALDRLSGDRPLLLTLLRKFRETYAGSAAEVRHLWNSGDTVGAARELHILSGVAGNLGAVAVAYLASKGEAAIRQDLAGEVPGILGALDMALADFHAAIAGIREDDEVPEKPSVKAAGGALRTDLEELLSLVRTNNLRAVDVFAAQRTAIEAGLGQEACMILAGEIGSLDFESAERRLVAMTAKLPQAEK